MNAGVDTLGLYDADHVRPLLESGEWQLWIMGEENVEAIVLTEVMAFPSAKVLIIRGIAGDGINRWIGHLPAIEEWGKRAGCDRVRAIGRLGWERVLKDYRKVQVYMEKRL